RRPSTSPLFPSRRSSDLPLRVGRKYRTATMKMRKALAWRDRHCVWPGCERPPEWTQGDHELPWAKGGKTEVEGMRLVCLKHHGRSEEHTSELQSLRQLVC